MTPRRDIAWTGQTEEVVPSAARTTSGDSGILTGYGPARTLRVQLDVTAVAGTSPTLDVYVEDTLDGSTWNVLAPALARATAVSRQVVNITEVFADRLRVRWVIAGTSPSFTFSVAWSAE
jgi:hypothetical protein